MTLYPGLGGQPPWAQHLTSQDIVAIARRADELGYAALDVPWHTVVRRGAEAAAYGPRWPDALSAAGFLLGATARICVMPLVVVPCQQPVMLAKALSTLDWMSGGRLRPGLLAGYLRSEFEFLNAAFAERGAIMDEYVAAMVELWTSENPAFNGQHVAFDGIIFEPKPAQTPLPLWFGGRAKSALRRIARYGSGWTSYATPHREMRNAIEYIRSQPEFVANPRPLSISAYFVESGHDPLTHAQLRPRRVIVGAEEVLEQLSYLASIGIDETDPALESKPGSTGKAVPIATVGEYLERMQWFAEEIMPAAHEMKSCFAATPPST